jgi:choline dehydrogenase-like flavoprotein
MTHAGYPRRSVLAGAAAGALIVSHRVVAATIGGMATDAQAVLARHWDVVIVGGGSAGCVLARRLSEDKGRRVLLLEAGQAVSDPAVSSPPAWPSLAGGAYDWGYHSVPQPGLGGRSVAEPRGKGLGGSTLINALGFQRGPHAAYDHWARMTGDTGWSFESLLPYFRRLESASGGASEWRGGDGPLHVLQVAGVADQNPFSQAIAQAGMAAGHPLNPDWNGAHADGTVWTQLTVRGGQRDTAASAFLDPVRSRPNLAIVTGAQALRVIVSHGKCDGVEVMVGGRTLRVNAAETVLSAGAIDSPRLLMLSGVGDPVQLAQHGIAVAAPVPGVGRGLQDHPLIAGLCFSAKRAIPVSHYNHCETMVITSSEGSPGAADLQLMALSVPFLLPHIGPPPPNAFSIVPALMKPRSVGAITLSSADPRAAAIIDPNYLAEEADVAAIVEAVEIARAFVADRAMADWVAQEVYPGAGVHGAALAAHIRRAASPFFHPVSTCRMGGAHDPGAVVDTQCRVRGVERLRVIDASVIPAIPQAMTNAATLVLAERAADLMRSHVAA